MSQHSSRGASWEALRTRVLERDEYICAYCQGMATTADHVLAKSQGGTDTMENLVASCLPCNARKGAKRLLRNTWLNPRHFPNGL